MENKTTLVIGASENPERYSNKAIRSLKQKGHEVIALAKRSGEVEGVNVSTEFPEEFVDTVTMYVGTQHQGEYYKPILNMKPRRVIFNPGTENPDFIEKLEERGIEAVEACTLVMLSIGNY